MDDWDYEDGFEQFLQAIKEEQDEKKFQIYLSDRNAYLQATGKILPFGEPKPQKKESAIEQTMRIQNDIKNLDWGD